MADLRIITQLDFSGGENSTVSPYLIGPKQSSQVLNMVLSEHGSLKTRDGTLIQYPGNAVQGLPINKIATYVKNAGNTQTVLPIAIAAGNVYKISVNPWVLIGAISAQFGSFVSNDIINYTNLIIISNMLSGPPKSWDGTTYATLTDTGAGTNLIPNGALHFANYGGYLHLANTALVSATLSAHGASVGVGPSSLQASDVNNANSWPVANQIYVAKDDGQQITGLGLFTIAESGIAPLGSLVIFKDFSTYQMSGYWGSSLGQGTALALQKTKSDMGCVAGRSIQFMAPFGLIRLTHKGFALFDGVNDTLISEEISNRIFGLDGFPGLDWSQIQTAQASQVPYPSLYVCACAQVGDSFNKLSIIFIYDLVLKAWTVAEFATPIGSLYLSEVPFSLPVLLGGDAPIGINTGKVRRYFSGDLDDDGTVISWQATLKPVFSQTPMDRSYFRRALLDVNVPGTPTNMVAQWFYGATSKVIVKTPPTRTQDSVIPFDLGYIANNTYPLFIGTGPITIRGIEYHVRPKPAGRSVVSVSDG